MFRDYFFSSWYAVVYFNRGLKFVRETVKRGDDDKNKKSKNRHVTSEQKLQFPCTEVSVKCSENTFYNDKEVRKTPLMGLTSVFNKSA